MPRTPKYCHHKGRNLAYITVDGKVIYLGKFNSPESRDRYDAEILKWRAKHGLAARHSTTIGQLCLKFIEHADRYYRDKKTDEPTGEADNYRQSLRRLLKLFRSVPCCEFGPKRLQELQAALAKEHVRQQVNKHVSRVKAVFRWGVAQEIVSPDVVTALSCVKGLQEGRCEAEEGEPVKPVPEGHLQAALKEMTANVKAMVQVQLLTGARPSEIRLMQVGDVDTSGDVWLYRPGRHKNAWRGKDRTIFIGPKAQAVLMPLLGDAVQGDLFVFRSKVKVNQPYTLHGYISSIQKACDKAEVPRWSPGQLRHNAATLVNRKFGDIDGARVVLGHSEKSTTQIYAERDLQKAAEIAREIG